MNYQHLITIIVPVYNVEKYLHRCVDSIINQTYNKLEIIMVDDGSPDNCGTICDEYARHDKRIIVIHKENGGLSSARNAALDIATGDYVMFVDSDDWVEPDFCKSALEMIIREQVLMASFGYNNVCYEKDSKSYKKYGRFTKRARIINSSEAIRHLILKDDVIFNFMCNKIYDRNLFKNIRFPLGKTYEDNAVTYRLVDMARTIYVSDLILYNYVRHNNSISGTWYTQRSISDRFEIWSQRLKFISKKYPENEDIQMKQLALEAVEGIGYINNNCKYNYVLGEMHEFLDNNKKNILSHNPSFRILIYYYAKPLLPLIKVARRTRDFLRAIKK